MEIHESRYPPVKEHTFKKISIIEIKNVLQNNLREYFENVSVTVTECPDLSLPPFSLAAKGFGKGLTTLMDIGGPSQLVPSIDRTKLYDFKFLVPNIVGSAGYPDGWYISGAGAGHWPTVGSNSELIASLKIGKDKTVELSKSKVVTSWVNELNQNTFLRQDTAPDESRFAVLANVMVSEGTRGEVLDIKCSRRKHDAPSFTECIRGALEKEYKDEPVGLGGTFIADHSKCNIHVMQDFSKVPLLSEQDVNKWLHFYDMGPPMLFQSVLVSADPGLDLRVEHSHGWSLTKDEGGHYHYDTSPDTVEYQGYFAVAHKLFRLDQKVQESQADGTKVNGDCCSKK